MRILIFWLSGLTLALKGQQQLSNFGNLVLHPNATVSFLGDFLNNGLLVDSASSVILNGTTTQAIKGTSPSTFKNLILSNQAGASLASTLSISKELNILSGTFSTNNQPLTLISDIRGTARVAPLTGDLVGNITMQRYLPAGNTGWRFLASPVYSATINDWQDDFITSGFPGSTYPAYSFTSIYAYDESVAGYYDNGFVSPLSANDPITNGDGFWCYIGPVPLTVDVTGPAGKFQHNFPVTFNSTSTHADDGWKMIGNPYPSSIDWNSSSWTKTNINSAIYIWNPQLQQFASYINGSGTNGGTNVIPSSQSFWVQANSANPVLSCNEQVKTASDQAFLRPNPGYVNKTMQLSMAGNGFSDECIIRFGQAATNGYDNDADARKFLSSNPAVPSIYSSDSTGDSYSINSFAPINKSVVIPVTALVPASGIYSFSLQLNDFQSDQECLVLEDRLTGTKTLLTISTSFTCQLWDTTTTARFLIHVTPSPVVKTTDPNCSYSKNGLAIVNLHGTGTYQLSYYDQQNQLIASRITSKSNDTLQGISGGTYYVQSSINNGICPGSTLSFVINTPAPVTAAFSLVKDSLLLGADTLRINNLSKNAQNYVWDFGDKSTDSLANPGHVYKNSGHYLLRLYARNNSGCVDTTETMVNVQVPGIITALGTHPTDEQNELFPNPSTGMVQFAGKIFSPTDLRIFAADGKLVLIKKIYSADSWIDLSELSKGLYFYKLDDKTVETKKLILQ